MSKSDEFIAELTAIAFSDLPTPERFALVEARLAAFREELDRWAGSEPADEDLLHEKGADLNERLADRLQDPALTPEERQVLEHAARVQEEAANRVPLD